jgi:uncharacterized protein
MRPAARPRWAAPAAAALLVCLLSACLLSACVPQRELSRAGSDLPGLWEAARQAVSDGLQSPPPAYEDLALSDYPVGLFVRLCTHDEELGCQGFLRGVEEPLVAARMAARNAAFHDRRYPAATPGRLQGADLELTLVGRLCRMRGPLDFVPGRHAVYLRYHSYTAFIQPSVAREHGYSREAFLDAVAQKAGLKPGTWRSSEVELFRAEAREYRRPFSSGFSTGR